MPRQVLDAHLGRVKADLRRRAARIAREQFGIAAFRAGQLELIDAVASGRDALGILATGAGKSLVYQVASQLFEGLTVVVSPLIALMQDQTDKLAETGVEAARLDSTVKRDIVRSQKRKLRQAKQGLLYVTPERLEKPEERAWLRAQGVALLVVDEAHCVSQWGHDFRPAYLSVRGARAELGDPPLLALTATATPAVADDIRRELHMRDALVVRGSVLRGNLRYEVQPAVSPERKRELLRALLAETRGSAIVYVSTVREAEEVAEWLVAQRVPAERYHGQLAPRDRERIQDGFMSGRRRIVVATKAFGLGIDKADIRLVAHWNFPDSLESYTQETGRAGRDGQPARAVLLYRLEDKRVQSFFLIGKYPSRSDCERFLHALDTALREDPRGPSLRRLSFIADVGEKRAKVVAALLERMGLVERRGGRLHPLRTFRSAREMAKFINSYETRHRRDVERLETMMRYAQRWSCRARAIAEYFGEAPERDCGVCDVCSAERKQKPEPKQRERKPRPPRAEDAPTRIGFSKGDAVEHARFGRGRVEGIEAAQVRVQFARGGRKLCEPAALALLGAIGAVDSSQITLRGNRPLRLSLGTASARPRRPALLSPSRPRPAS
jgi:ATP-dependent DNA helicase RecQ